MSKPEMPTAEKLPARDFKNFTQTKNKLLKDLKIDQDDENLLLYIRQNVSGALSEFLDILFEQAGLDQRISDSPDLKFLRTLDFTEVTLNSTLANIHCC